MIKINGLEYRYPGSPFLLRIPKLELEDREQVAIVGPSGSGKTTLLNLIAGILQSERGTIEFGEQKLEDLPESQKRELRANQIGLVFQEFELLEYLSVKDNILLPYRISQSLVLNQQVQERLEQLAEAVGISEKLKRSIRKLSQGERQRVAICRALLTKPKLVLADEPTGNLDPLNKQRIVDLLIEQCRQSEASLIAVTHDHSLLSQFDRTVDLTDLIEQPDGSLKEGSAP